MNEDFIIELARLSQKPLPNPWLEILNPTGEPYWRFLYLMAAQVRPSCSIVIGTEDGIDVAHIAAGWMEGSVLGLDIIKKKHEWSRVRRKCANARFMVGRAHEVGLPAWVKDVGLVYQDSSHHYEESVKEWERFIPLLSHGAVWICDDVSLAFYDPEVDPPNLGMVEYFYSRPGKKLIVPGLHRGNAIGIVLL